MNGFQLHRDAPKKSNAPKTFSEKLGKHWFTIVLILFTLHVIFNKDVKVNVNFSDKQNQEIAAKMQTLPASFSVPGKRELAFEERAEKPVVKSAINAAPVRNESLSKKNTAIAINRKWKAEDFDNLSFVLHRDLARKKGVAPAIVKDKLNNCRQYVERFATVAIAEKDRFSIPASITLAQGILATDAGRKLIATRDNNHFALPCDPECLDCSCNLDIHLQSFRSAWASYRQHSKTLSGPRYAHLKNLSTKDYQGWARGLQKAGYSDDPQYAKKLIRIIESLDLFLFDAAA